MFELEDYNSGYHDGFLSKYVDPSGPALDFYISDSLQDMLDIDIRAEVATVVGGSNELASLASDLPSSFDNVDSISNDCLNSHNNLYHSSSWFGGTGPTWSSSNDFYADVGACVNPRSVMPMISSSLLHRSPKVNFNTNRSSISPCSPASPIENKSHLTFSPHQIKISSARLSEQNDCFSSNQQQQSQSNSAISSLPVSLSKVSAPRITTNGVQRKGSAVDSVRKELVLEATRPDPNGNIISDTKSTSNGILTSTSTNTIKLAPGIGGLTFANSVTYNKLKQQSSTTISQNSIGAPVTSNGTMVLKRDRDSSPLHNMTTLSTGSSFHNNHLHNHHQQKQQQPLQQFFQSNQQQQQVNSQKMTSKNVVHTGVLPKSIASSQSPLMQSNSSVSSHSSSSNAGHIGNGITPTSVPIKLPKTKQAPIESEFPKPAYSYSCLIAIALKNSRSGSLPVSEIYSFMCEHFPYFKTARSGWKNSVRHNLSLNKCFEKIEKPATNGSQRKGFLWAMNPTRIAKMDEEVQKWSRKDPMAIRNAMVFPENLEALERGEMKHGSSGDSDVELDSQSEIEEASDSELDDNIVESHDMYIEEEVEEMTSIPQQHRDFDIEVEDIYDAIDMEDDKDAIDNSHNETIEMNTGDLVTGKTVTGYKSSPKRRRLNLNYSIGLQQTAEQQSFAQNHSSNLQNLNNLQSHQQMLSSSSQQQVVHLTQNIQHQTHLQEQHKQHSNQFQQMVTTVAPSTTSNHHNRRKMQLVNRIA